MIIQLAHKHKIERTK